nr:hypothetical protein CFP56_55945 [Quercus suber]
MRPSSPLSPGYKTQRFDTLQVPSSRNMHSRPGVGQRRLQNAPMRLPSLPRFHPANYPSAQSSTQTSPDAVAHSPQAPLSPRSHQHMYSDAQRQLFMHQREMVSAASRDHATHHTGKPAGPRLAPMGSPGPVTPLELEGEESYLVAGARSAAAKHSGSTDEFVDKLIRDEVKRHWKSQGSSRGSDWSR